jgi:hypothetical protein
MDFALPVPLDENETPETAPLSAVAPINPLMALFLKQQKEQQERQRRQEEANSVIREDVSRQRGQAQALRNVALISSFGANPLLRGLQDETGNQGAQLEGLAARSEVRIAPPEGRGIDPLGIARLQQLAEYQKGRLELDHEKEARQKAEAEAKKAAAEAKAKAATAKAAASAAEKAKKEEDKRAEVMWKSAESMRKEFSNLPDVKDFTEFEDSYKGLQSALKRPGGVGSAAAIFNFMKLIDPGVAVMEGDVDRIRASAGPAAKFADLYEYAKSGNTLPDTVRKELGGMADELYGIRKERHDGRRKQYEGLAKKRGVDPDSVLPPVLSPAMEPPQRTPAHQAMPPGPGGSLLLGPPPTAPKTGGNTVRVKVNGQELPPMPRANLEEAKKRAAAKGYTLEVIDG